MSLMTGFVIVVMEQLGLLWTKLNPHPFGIYGATQVGKTTLHHQLRTRGDVPEIKKRTVGRSKATRKTIGNCFNAAICNASETSPSVQEASPKEQTTTEGFSESFNKPCCS